MTALIFAMSVALAAGGQHEGPDYFQVMCQRYLILEDPDFLERETTDDLEILLPTLKARHMLYSHPLDKVMTKLIEHELWTRDAVTPRLRLIE